jgi:predicted MFS family arabinose efflux permease
LICYGAADALGSIACEPLIKLIGRVPIAIFGAILNLALILTMLLWRPNPDEPVVYFVIAALWGLADAIWHIQLNCNYIV